MTFAATAALTLSGCQAIGESARASDGQTDTAPSVAEQQAALSAAAEEYLRRNPGLIAGIAVRHGDVNLEFGAEQRFETASVVKVELLVRWLLLRQDGALPRAERELAERMIVHSDNDATDQLCRLLAAEPATDELPGATGACRGGSGWGADETTAADQREVLSAAFDAEPLSDDSRELVAELMGGVVDTQAWGVSAAANAGEKTWLKNGWDVRDNGWLAHSAGVIDSLDAEPVYLTVLTNGNATEAEGIARVEDLAGIARDSLTP